MLTTIVTVSSKDLYRELRLVLAPIMKRAGFRRLKSGHLGWVRESADRALTLWFQSSKWGWTDRWGSTFTLEFQIVSPSINGIPSTSRNQRIGYLLEGFEELDELRLMNNRVIERLPGTTAREWVTRSLPDGTNILVEGHKPDPQKAVYGRDLWFNYHSIEDVRAWAAYFSAKLPRFITLFENEIRSAQGQASVRFHRMMGEVQRAADLKDKMAMLQDYISAERDQQCRSAAQHYLGQVQDFARANHKRNR